MRDGRVRRAWIGIAGGARPLPPRIAARLGRRARRRGGRGDRRLAGRARAACGRRTSSSRSDGAPVRGIDDLQRLLTAERIDRAVELEVVREGDRRRRSR